MAEHGANPADEARRLLLLGGTREALELARALTGDPRLHVITSLAGRTRDPAAIPGEVRVGGFGGSEGLAAYLEREAIGLVIDATHPFAATMAGNAAAACVQTGAARLKLLRPPWRRVDGDHWIEAADAADAAAALPGLAERVFLTTGRQELAAFAGLEDTWFLVRLIDRPNAPLPLARHHLVLGRGPFAEAEERVLLREHRIGALVAKNSGGALTYAKIAAARALGLPVVMVERPAPPAGETAESVDQAKVWLQARLAERSPDTGLPLNR